MTAVLTIDDIRRCFGETRALAGVSFELCRGEWLGLLGPNGAGKTTTVRAVAGRVRLDDGRITLLDTPLDSSNHATAGARARLGIVPQELAVYPLLTARENLMIFGKLHGLRTAANRERVEWALDFTGLVDRAEEPTKRFSGGMKRRLNIACGVLHQPEVLLLDEPTAGVDPQSRERIWEMLGTLKSTGTSLLLTTHQLDEAERVCEHIVIIDHGKVIADGTLEELIEKTVGPSRTVTLTLDGPARPISNGFEVTDNQLRGAIEDVAGELPAALAAVASGGQRVLDVRVDAPTLHAVFLHLTGRELRE